MSLEECFDCCLEHKYDSRKCNCDCTVFCEKDCEEERDELEKKNILLLKRKNTLRKMRKRKSISRKMSHSVRKDKSFTIVTVTHVIQKAKSLRVFPLQILK